MSEYNRHRWAMEWMYGGGRDPKGRSLDDEIKLGKEDWLERQRVARIGPNPTFAPQEIDMPNWRDLIREEGVQVGEQVAEGGRIGLQSGQLVQPGPGRPGYQGNIARTPEGFNKEQIKIARKEIKRRAKQRNLPEPNFNKFPGKGYAQDTEGYSMAKNVNYHIRHGDISTLGKGKGVLAAETGLKQAQKVLEESGQIKIFEMMSKNPDLSVKDIAKALKIDKKTANRAMSNLLKNIYNHRWELGTGLQKKVRRTGELKLKDPSRSTSAFLNEHDPDTIKKVLRSIRDSRGFKDAYERSMYDLVLNAYEGQPQKLKQAYKRLNSWFDIQEAFREQYPKLYKQFASQLDHPLAYQSLEIAKVNPEGFVHVTPIPKKLNQGIKSRLDSKYKSIVKEIKASPNNKDLILKKAKFEKFVDDIGFTMGKVSKTGERVISYGAKDIMRANLGKEMLENLDLRTKIAERVAAFDDKELKKVTKEIFGDVGGKKYRASLKAIKPDDPKKLKQAKTVLTKLIRQLGCGLYSGGRVAFANAGKVDCFQKGLLKIQTKNIATKGDAAVMKKIVQTGAKKGAARTALMWLGPLGIGGDVLFEAGDIAVQMLGGKPLDEALRNNWITGAFIDQTEKEARDIKLFKETGPGPKKYVEGTEAYEKLQKMYNVLEMMKQKQEGSNIRGRPITDEMIKQQEEAIKAQERYVRMLDEKEPIIAGGAGQEEYEKASDELKDKRGATSWATEQKLKYREDPPQSDRYKSMNIDLDFKPIKPPEKQFDTVDKMANYFITDDIWNAHKDAGWKDKTELFVEARKQDPEFNKMVWYNIMNFPGEGDRDIKGSGETFFRGTYDQAPTGHHFVAGGRVSYLDGGIVSLLKK
jgi:hypothetical protein